MNALYIFILFMKSVIYSIRFKNFFKPALSREFFINNDSAHKELLKSSNFLKGKKLISISPGGYKGIYMLGVCTFIKDMFDLDNYIFSGASAGAWNALTLCYKKDPRELKNLVLDYSIKNAKTINEIETMMKRQFLLHAKTEDFDLRRLFIGVTTIDGFGSKTYIYHGFTTLEDAIDCCIASSHIPFITGGLVHKYKNVYSFDGGFSKHPYITNVKPELHICPSMWKEKPGYQGTGIFDITQYTTLFSRKNFDFSELYNSGYNDAKNNYDYLKYFLGNSSSNI